jgi:nicotinamide riboside kinase
MSDSKPEVGKKSKYINFVSGPSGGKSLMTALTFAKLKSLHYSSEMVQEYAKMLVYMEDFEMLNCQWLVSYQQYNMLRALRGKVEYICCDSPLLVGLFYNRYYETNVCDRAKTEKMILEKMKDLEPSVYIFLERNDDFPFEKEGRVQGEEESKKIDQLLKNLLDEFDIKYLSIKSDTGSVDAIVDYILQSNT